MESIKLQRDEEGSEKILSCYGLVNSEGNNNFGNYKGRNDQPIKLEVTEREKGIICKISTKVENAGRGYVLKWISNGFKC